MQQVYNKNIKKQIHNGDFAVFIKKSTKHSQSTLNFIIIYPSEFRDDKNNIPDY